ncbi:MAG: hypothetical protein Q7T55_18645 [Solirubrobacteraceae bacterium]|nr:hypothetical protein [Solirubrobacteraceae bacterium]
MSVSLRRSRLVALAAAATFSGAAAVPAAAATSTAVPVTGVQTAVAPDAGLVAGLTSLGTTVRLTGAATADPAGRFVFPVTGGSLTPELKGKVNHTGGIEFHPKGRLKFGIRTFVIDTRGTTPQLTAEPTLGGLGLGIRVPVADIDGLGVASAPPATVVSGTLKLTDIGALYINTLLGKSAVKRGTVFGQAEATVTLGS